MIDHTSQDFNDTKGIEILSFQKTELLLTKGGSTKFCDVGTLFVLYFPDYNRFVLSINNWTYALLKRIPVVGSTHTMSDSRLYIFQAT